MRSRQSSQLSLLQVPPGSSITEVDEGRSTLTRTPSYDTSNPSSRASSPLFYLGSQHPRYSSDRGPPQRMSSTEREDTPLSSGLLRRQAGQGEELSEKAPSFDEREELEVSPEVDSPSPHQQHLQSHSSQEHEEKEQETGSGGGGDTSTLDSIAEDLSTTLVKSGGPLV